MEWKRLALPDEETLLSEAGIVYHCCVSSLKHKTTGNKKLRETALQLNCLNKIYLDSQKSRDERPKRIQYLPKQCCLLAIRKLV